jgi:hypothetical protein
MVGSRQTIRLALGFTIGLPEDHHLVKMRHLGQLAYNLPYNDGHKAFRKSRLEARR